MHKKISSVLIAVIFCALFTLTSLAWGPASRKTYTSQDKVTEPTFNSVTDLKGFGDERNFVSIREAGVGNYGDEVTLVQGKEYEVYIFFENNCDSELNDIINKNGVGIAVDVRLNAIVPKTVKAGERLPITSAISSANTVPAEIWDEAYVTATNDIDLRYVPASAIIHSNGAVNGRVLPDTLFSETGTFLGYDSLNGVIQGGAQYSGYVVYKLKADAPDFTIDSFVSSNGKDFLEKIAAKPGKELTFKIVYKNTGTTDQNDVTIKDDLPDFMSYVKGSTVVVNASNPNGLTLDDTNGNITTGINIGGYGKGATAEITFKAKAAKKSDIADKNRITNLAYAITNNGTKSDSIDVSINAGAKNSVFGLILIFVIGAAALIAIGYFVLPMLRAKKK
ncbi:MAG: DUF11 domain-containing protein [Oscillospiraceae bacterium]|jgi:uncharacterized repeat protein (TIGR01451 family)|nr:DUF11 domain-containing protein [Oscillospiraceae bacterium]